MVDGDKPAEPSDSIIRLRQAPFERYRGLAVAAAAYQLLN
jgi:hypothetical protein